MSENAGKMKKKSLVIMYAAVLGIIALLALYETNVRNYKTEEDNVQSIPGQIARDKEECKDLVSAIGDLSASERIEEKALELGMHKADTEEIVRVEIKDEK